MKDYGNIYIRRANDASILTTINWKNTPKIPYKSYDIKETDFRVKTATFTSPQYLDLTRGQYYILIQSSSHENFGGIILDVDYDEETHMYTYQCQDYSRKYISKFEYLGKNVKLYNLLVMLLTKGGLPVGPTLKQLQNYKKTLSGLRAKGKYNQNLYKGNRYSGNPMDKMITLIARDKSYIEVIRSVVYNSLGWFDVWFNDSGVLQIEPISKDDWENTGLVLSANDYKDRKFKFSTTNAITSVRINGTDLTGGFSDNLLKEKGLSLASFFGGHATTINNPTQQNKNTTNAVKTNNTTTKTSKTKNPYGNKAKKVWIGADGGSGPFCQSIIKELKKQGWKCHYSGANSEVHYNDFWKVSKDYQVLAIVDNGFDPVCVKEVYDNGSVKNRLKKLGITYVFIFDSRDWNHEFKPYKYGNFKNFKVGRAHDDGYSNWHGTMNVYDYFKKHNVHYCCHSSAKGIADQFVKGSLTCK